MQFRRRPVEVEARQWIGGAEFATPIINWILAEGGTARWHEERRETISPYRPDDINEIDTPECISIDVKGANPNDSRFAWVHFAWPGDWIILDDGRFYMCKPEEFDAQYEPVDAD